jgi:uncharacterized protein YeaO (DUF488 family)
MPILTRRYNDPKVAEDEGLRVLVTRYRPRGVRREDETWDVWWPNLGPSKELHAAFFGKSGPAISWEEYAREYVEEVTGQTWWLESLAKRVAANETVTLCCSSACTDPARCHRTLLGAMIGELAAPPKDAPPRGVVRRRGSR